MRCRVCGREFDPRGFQVVVPALGEGFDRVECALDASALGPPPVTETPALPAVLKPLPAAPVAAFAGAGAGAAARPPLLVGGNIALLAAGTAVTIYLWLRVFGVDLAPLGLTPEGAAQPYGRTVVPAQIDLTPAVPRPAQPAGDEPDGGGVPPLPASPTGGGTDASGGGGGGGGNGGGGSKPSSEKPSKPTRGAGAARPQPTPSPAPTPPAEPEPPRTPSAPVPSNPPKPDRPGIPTPGGPDRPPGIPGGQPDRPPRSPGQSPFQGMTRGS